MATAEQPEERTRYRLGGMGYQDVSGRRLSYGSYLRIPELLDLQKGLTEAHDELLFIVVHQAYELWFKVLLHEVEAARDVQRGCLALGAEVRHEAFFRIHGPQRGPGIGLR